MKELKPGAVVYVLVYKGNPAAVCLGSKVDAYEAARRWMRNGYDVVTVVSVKVVA